MSSAFSSISSSDVVPKKKYEVFLSFRGEDTRRNFTSHLYDALSRKKIKIFIDNNELQKGDEISAALIKAIEESHASIVIFSENYASSKWCLNELKKILECKKYMEQIVIPVFYNIDPSNVRKQTGSYKQAFAKHKRDLKHNNDKLKKWKDSLTEAANLVGWDSQNYRSDSDFIKAIVEDVLRKLNPRYPYDIKGLVGIEKNYEQIESMMEIGSNDVKIIGIWGMGGIGKTTIARTLCGKLYSQFEVLCFHDVMDESNKYGVNGLHNKLLSSLLEEEKIHPDASYIESSFSVRRIAHKKVLIVLDGMETLEKIEDLIQIIDGVGPGSRVIITTRDKHILSQFSNCEIYEFNELNKHDSLQLFSLFAFGEKQPKIGYEDLSESVIAYCRGNPLALKVLGKNLRSRGKIVWEDELKKLEKIPNGEINNMLKLSYDNLDIFQKDIFLDIACLLRGDNKMAVIHLLEACEFFAESGIEVLLDKALIQIKSNWLSLAKLQIDGLDMHDLLQEMGWEIVNQESKEPGKRSRLWRAEEISDILKENKGTEVVEGIIFDSTDVGDIYLKSDSFRRMTNLRYLNIYNESDGSTGNVYFPDGLEWISDKLRYLRWKRYCLESLPSTFCAEMLVELCMAQSKLKKLWDGVQNLVNLRTLWLESSKDLIEIPDLSRATNLAIVLLSECESLRQLHPSIFSLPQLQYLDLRGCISIESLKTNIHSKSLCQLLLNGCSSLTEFSMTSEEMTKLSLCDTSIHELTSSIWHNTKLTVLDLAGCNKLTIVGNKLTDDHGLGSVTELDLSGCTEINASSLWSILDGIQSLKRLKLNECVNLECLPENMGKHSLLEWLELDDCRKLVSLTELPPSLLDFKAVNCTYLDTYTTQRSFFDNMTPNFLENEGDIDFFFFLPGAQVPLDIDLQTIEASITILPITKSVLRGFIFCILFSEGFTINRHVLYCIIFECGKEVDRRRISLNYLGTLISDHVLMCWHGYNIQESGSYDCNLSFQFILQGPNEELWWSTEGIKGCGVFPVRKVYMSSCISKEIGKLKSIAQDSDVSIAIGGEGRSSNNENEYDQEQPSYSHKEEEQPSIRRPPIKHVYVRRRRKVIRPKFV
ncbi:putative TIR domain, winged helix-turn-helix DNA-binding domain-containing protein [Medicago truncatula]|uniref:Putative TIR domain, winged helix-turn-helix DNA-binding domain-containing protein n=1 Tax=Medicago truncatula TaxID=3880 RepID=A0A396IRQ3_MEDTR|nr:disease resistance protein RPV1 isoform X1 [Medicago truncatula]RHN67381.1 putative TIR domain, winged helix-turn-helix DNA-binding domain-containing protein [Medicago truncatula]